MFQPMGGTYFGHWGRGVTYLPGNGGYLCSSQWGVPTLARPWETEQHSKYFLRDRQYASCVDVGGLSCLQINCIYFENFLFSQFSGKDGTKLKTKLSLYLVTFYSE